MIFQIKVISLYILHYVVTEIIKTIKNKIEFILFFLIFYYITIHSVIRQSSYQAIKLSGNQVIRQSSYQAIKLSGNQVIKLLFIYLTTNTLFYIMPSSSQPSS